MSISEFEKKRFFLGCLPEGMDLIRAIEALCRENGVRTACFSVTGAVSAATVGTFDQTQQVYITHRANRPFEIVGCTGNVSVREGAPFVYAHVTLADESGQLTGGRLFSETTVYTAEIALQELAGQPLVRHYDPTTGMLLWEANPGPPGE